MLTVYYSHSKQIYDSPEEGYESCWLKSIFPKVICPNIDRELIASYNTPGYFTIFKEYDIIVCSELNRYIGKGVFSEMLYAIGTGKLALVMRWNRVEADLKPSYKLYRVLRVEVYDDNDWKFKYGTLITEDTEYIPTQGN